MLLQELLLLAAGFNSVQRKQPLNAATQISFKNCAPFKYFRSEINDTFLDYTGFINVAMPMYNLVENSDNYSDSSGILWSFKRDEVTDNSNVSNDNNAPSFIYETSIMVIQKKIEQKWD